MEFGGRKDGVELITQQILTQVDFLQSVADAVQKFFRNEDDAVLGEVQSLKGHVAGREELGRERLVTGKALRKAVNSVTVG